MKIDNIASNNGLAVNKLSEKELKLAADEFTAMFYKTVLSGMVKAGTAQKPFREEMWWDMMITEVANKISSSPNDLSKNVYSRF